MLSAMLSSMLCFVLLTISSIARADLLLETSSAAQIESTQFDEQAVVLASKLSTSKSVEEMRSIMQIYSDNPKVVSEAVFLFEIYHKTSSDEGESELYQAKKRYLEQQGFYDFSLKYKIFYTVNPQIFNLLLGIFSLLLLLLFLLLKKRLRKNYTND